MRLKTYVLVPEVDFSSLAKDPLGKMLDQVVKTTHDSSWQKAQAVTNVVNDYLNRKHVFNTSQPLENRPSAYPPQSDNVQGTIPQGEHLQYPDLTDHDEPSQNTDDRYYQPPEPNVVKETVFQPQIVYLPGRTIIKESRTRKPISKNTGKKLTRRRQPAKMDVEESPFTDDEIEMDDGSSAENRQLTTPGIRQIQTVTSNITKTPPIPSPVLQIPTSNVRVSYVQPPMLDHSTFPTHIEFPPDGEIGFDPHVPLQNAKATPAIQPTQSEKSLVPALPQRVLQYRTVKTTTSRKTGKQPAIKPVSRAEIPAIESGSVSNKVGSKKALLSGTEVAKRNNTTMLTPVGSYASRQIASTQPLVERAKRAIDKSNKESQSPRLDALLSKKKSRKTKLDDLLAKRKPNVAQDGGWLSWT